MARKETLHTHYLHELTKPYNLRPALETVGMSIDSLVSVIVEPDYINNIQHVTMCDYLFLFENKICVPGELKGSRGQRRKARSQLKSGKEYAINLLDYTVDRGLFTIYHADRYIHERINL